MINLISSVTKYKVIYEDEIYILIITKEKSKESIEIYKDNKPIEDRILFNHIEKYFNDIVLWQ